MPTPAPLDTNAVVSYNIAAIRHQRHMTQVEVARRLGEFTGHVLPQASISAMERGYTGVRRRHFDVHEIYLLAVVFNVPMVYFFLPPPADIGREMADTGHPASALCSAVLGTDHQLDEVVDLCAQHDGGAGSDAADRTTRAGWARIFKAWRSDCIDVLLGGHGKRLVEAAGLLAELADAIHEVRTEALAELAVPPEDRSRPRKGATPPHGSGRE